MDILFGSSPLFFGVAVFLEGIPCGMDSFLFTSTMYYGIPGAFAWHAWQAGWLAGCLWGVFCFFSSLLALRCGLCARLFDAVYLSVYLFRWVWTDDRLDEVGCWAWCVGVVLF